MADAPKPTKLAVKVVPGSSRSGVAGWLGETLKLRVTAPPERGKANAAVEALLADALGIAPDQQFPGCYCSSSGI